MDLIDKEKTLHDLTTFLHQKCALADTRIFFGILEVVEKQEAWIKLHGNLQYRGAILAPCPRCGSFEVEVTTRRISDPDSIYYNHLGVSNAWPAVMCLWSVQPRCSMFLRSGTGGSRKRQIKRR